MKMKGKYNSISVANYIINQTIEMDSPVSNLKLQKLLYYVQVASLVDNKIPMFDDEISAWKYGPVVETIYHIFKRFVDKPIDEAVDEAELLFWDDSSKPIEIGVKDRNLIDKVITSYRNYSAISLVKKTHREDPWKNAFYNGKNYIANEDMERYYGKGENRQLIYG